MHQKDLNLASQTLRRNWEKYRGQHVLVVGNQIYAAKIGKKAEQIYHKLEQENSEVAPLISYIPQEGSLIL